MSTANIQQQYSKSKQFNFRALISSTKENSMEINIIVTSGNFVYFRRLNSGTSSSSVWRTRFSICVAQLYMYSLWLIPCFIRRLFSSKNKIKLIYKVFTIILYDLLLSFGQFMNAIRVKCEWSGLEKLLDSLTHMFFRFEDYSIQKIL